MITPSFGLTATERVLPKLALDFTTASLDGRITFTRTTGASNPATYVNSSGYITAATNNQPRFDYDPVTLACKGLLIEESRTNNYLYSETFSNSTYTWTASSVVSNNLKLSPDNTNYMVLLKEDNANATHILRKSYTTTAAAWTFSIFVCAYGGGSARNIGLLFNTNSKGALFNPATGELVEAPYPGTTTNSVYMGNGVYRISVSATTTAVTQDIRIYLGNGSTWNSVYQGDNTSGVYIWGAQLEAGAFATSYIPTTTTALTCNADVATMTGQGVAAQGTFVVDATVVSGKTLLTSGSVTFAATASTAQKTAVAYDINSVNKSINAGAVTSSAGATASTDITLGNGGIFRKVALYAPKMINAEMQAFSK